MKKRYVFGALLLSLTLLLTGCAGGAAKLSTGTQDLMKGVPVKSPAKMKRLSTRCGNFPCVCCNKRPDRGIRWYPRRP